MIESKAAIEKLTTEGALTMSMILRQNRRCWFCFGVILLSLGACSPGKMTDPAKVLADPRQSTARHRAAMSILEDQSSEEVSIRTFKTVMMGNGYPQETQMLAYQRLRSLDPEGLRRLLEIRLPRSQSLAWRRWVCEEIAREKWLEMTPSLIRAWAQPIDGWDGDPEDRPERVALVEIYGEENVPKVLLQVMLDANPITASNLRARCWELLIEEGQRGQLVDLLSNMDIDRSDGMLSDLKEIARRTGVIPRNREEILWSRVLCEPEHSTYLQETELALANLSEERRDTLELRDLAIVRATYQHLPELLQRSDEELYEELDVSVRSRERRVPSANFEGWGRRHSERLHEVKDSLRWGDLMAMLLAVRAMQVPEVLEHVFDYAERDLEDKATEYGGIIALDAQGRFVVLEFLPRVKQGDNKFVAPQAMFDKGYTALFHFHNHAQSYNNGQYAGPHLGDFTYARNTRANCLVFTFLSSRLIDVDYYRHGYVVVDLGAMPRPE